MLRGSVMRATQWSSEVKYFLVPDGAGSAMGWRMGQILGAAYQGAGVESADNVCSTRRPKTVVSASQLHDIHSNLACEGGGSFNFRRYKANRFGFNVVFVS